MRIAIAGTGMVGKYYGRAWVAAGHKVTFTHYRDQAAATEIARSVNASGAEPAVNGARFDAVLLAARMEALDDARSALGDCADTVLLDAVNPFNPERTGLVDLGGRLAADEVARRFPTARHVKAFHSLGIQRILDAEPGQRLVVFIAGDDPDAVAVACDLAYEAGVEPVVTGPLETARLSEPPGELFSQPWTRGMAVTAALGAGAVVMDATGQHQPDVGWDGFDALG